jgi:hypothetical protein
MRACPGGDAMVYLVAEHLQLQPALKHVFNEMEMPLKSGSGSQYSMSSCKQAATWSA